MCTKIKMIDLPLNKYAKNIHSQNGEDGIIAEIFYRLKLSDKSDLWCVEFGAWDGIYLSNTFLLVEMGWNSVYIEGDPFRYKDLLKTVQKFPKITPIKSFVARDSGDHNSLDNLLRKTSIPKEFELLSIDIDSYDCDVWESLTNYEPKVVIIEINSSIPPGILWRHSNKTQGSTFSSTLKVGVKKGYTLVCHTGNLIFVRNDLVDLLKLPKKFVDYPELLFLNEILPNNLLDPISTYNLLRIIIPKKLRKIFRFLKDKIN